MTLPTLLRKEEEALKTTEAATSTDSSEESKRAMEVLGHGMNSVCYIYDVDFSDLVEIHEAIAEEKPAYKMNFVL